MKIEDMNEITFGISSIRQIICFILSSVMLLIFIYNLWIRIHYSFLVKSFSGFEKFLISVSITYVTISFIILIGFWLYSIFYPNTDELKVDDDE